jgi:hypothetical protein
VIRRVCLEIVEPHNEFVVLFRENLLPILQFSYGLQYFRVIHLYDVGRVFCITYAFILVRYPSTSVPHTSRNDKNEIPGLLTVLAFGSTVLAVNHIWRSLELTIGALHLACRTRPACRDRGLCDFITGFVTPRTVGAALHVLPTL